MEEEEAPVVSHSDEGSPAKAEADAAAAAAGVLLDTNEETLQEDERSAVQQQQQNEDDDDEDDDEEKSVDPLESVKLGGTLAKPAFCLLDGIFHDPTTQAEDAAAASNNNKAQRIHVAMNRLPATLGRTHKSSDKSFFGLGAFKALSRLHFQIDFRTVQGGQVVSCQDSKKMGYKKSPKKEICNPTSYKLPATGFFAITCLGKNRIIVNGLTLRKGETAVLPSGSKVKISHYMLYFFTPTEPSTKTMAIVPGGGAAAAATKKRKPTAAASVTQPTTKRSKTGSTAAASGWPTLQAELDSMSVDELLAQLEAGMDAGNWDRRQQLVGSTLSYRAVLAAGRAPSIQATAKEHGGASRIEIMEWVEESEDFGKWRRLMLTKLEPKSYQASITKALIKAGFERTGSSGRYIKWILPASVLKKAKAQPKKAPVPAKAKQDAKKDSSTADTKTPKGDKPGEGDNDEEEESEDESDENDEEGAPAPDDKAGDEGAGETKEEDEGSDSDSANESN